ncbi:MAG TPA: hypothetical protein VGV18_02120, partial [Verrucomicrobiae bacterium]|nr:hypothetical protein [Verrucomicrobiae bacterium]
MVRILHIISLVICLGGVAAGCWYAYNRSTNRPVLVGKWLATLPILLVLWRVAAHVDERLRAGFDVGGSDAIVGLIVTLL